MLKARKNKSKPQAPKAFKGWLTSDDEEIERRRLRAIEERVSVRAVESGQPVFGTFAARSTTIKADAAHYTVEVRSFAEKLNSCSCPDFDVNGLGTCKHIEAVLAFVRKRRVHSSVIAEGSPRIEIYVDGGKQIRVAWPKRKISGAVDLIAPFFSSDGALLGDPVSAMPAIRRAVAGARPAVQSAIRIGQDVAAWTRALERAATRERAKANFMRDVAANKRSMDSLKVPLYDYQREGMMHLAFNERALLADEMGLGKTVQAIAACELLRQTRKIQRVLVISPASLKAEWEEQIAKFTGLPVRLVWGPRSERLKLYREPAFFFLANYEQIRMDVEDINGLMAPDVVVLDEAQRIKNWQTATARSVKRLSSPYAFVLTGTPLENRIDDVYSIFQVLDPRRLGPLFRFNRDFYELDERGMPQGYKNLDELRNRIRPLMLRRRKEEVEDQLPQRTVNNYFVGMEAEQQLRYDEYNARVAKLVAIAKRRPLTQDELKKLQTWLACMRMLCDTPFILDPECPICPKLGELESIMDEVLEDPQAKVLIFSEWERMLDLVRDLARRSNVQFAWHTGTVPQKARRAEIHRFKNDPDCRLFLSTDSGSVGLNLQAANVVINLDLPWNPAKLEQRIARAWRKHQARPVTVINLVCSNSIEQRMLGLLGQKQQLADGVLDGRGDLNSLKMPSGRAAFLERLSALMGTGPSASAAPPAAMGAVAAPEFTSTNPLDALREDLTARLAERLLLLEVSKTAGGVKSIVAVVDGDSTHLAPLIQKSAADNGINPEIVEVLDRRTYGTLRRLVDAGVLHSNASAVCLHRSASLGDEMAASRERRIAEGRKVFDHADRRMRMSRLLADGGFISEALPSARDAVRESLRAVCLTIGVDGVSEGSEISLELLQSRCVSRGLLPESTVGLIARLMESGNGRNAVDGEDSVRELHSSALHVYEAAQIALNKAAFG